MPHYPASFPPKFQPKNDKIVATVTPNLTLIFIARGKKILQLPNSDPDIVKLVHYDTKMNWCPTIQPIFPHVLDT